jgi:hypothetical protein
MIKRFTLFPLMRVLFVFMLTVSIFAPSSARAACDTECDCEVFHHYLTRSVIFYEHERTRDFINDEFAANQNWIVNDFFEEFFPALKLMTEQLVVNGMNQMMALGALFDAKEHMDAQRLFQQHTAEAHKDYQPSHDMCVIGTATMHLAGAEAGVRMTAHALAQRSIERQLGKQGTMSGAGVEGDSVSRLELVRSTYCNRNDNYVHMQYICGAGAPAGRRNNDIDYARMMGERMTLNVDFSNADLTQDEQDLFALSNYLYVNHPFARSTLTVPAMKRIEGQEAWINLRSVVAKHMVAENSFDNIIALKTASNASAEPTAEYLSVVFERMGVGKEDAQRLVTGMANGGGPLNRPSYYAMLQILSQSIYQTPSFFVNLYDTPANVNRKAVAMQAINLMLDREKYKSELRTEALLSQVLEMEVAKAQKELVGVYGRLKRTERTNPPPGPGP